jgi:hypothetical protein
VACGALWVVVRAEEVEVPELSSVLVDVVPVVPPVVVSVAEFVVVVWFVDPLDACARSAS